MNPRIAWILAVAVMLASPGTTTAEPDVPTPDDLPKITPGKSVTLTDALRLADERNLSIASARADILRAQAALKTSWGWLLPTATATVNFTHNDHADTASVGGQEIEIRKQQDLRGSLVVSAPLINAQLWQGVAVGDHGVDVAELTIEQVRQALLLSVAQAYYQGLAARSLVDIQENQIRSSQRHLAVATIRHRSGTGARLDVIRAQTELLTAREELLNAHRALDNARDALSVLILAEQDGLPMPAELPDIRSPEEPTKELLARALRQREDVRLAHALIAMADSQLTASWMQFIPSLSASWTATQQLTDLTQFGSQDETRWFIGLSLSIPIYDHVRYADLDDKRASLHKAELDAQNAELNARLEVRQARRDFVISTEQVETARKIAKLANESLRLAESAYENGTGNSLEVTDARRSSRLAEIDLATKRFEAQLTLLTLYRGLGEDMRKLGETPAAGAPVP